MVSIKEEVLLITCPRCLQPKLKATITSEGKLSYTHNALGRRDNKTYICSDCGTAEALEDFARRSK